MSNKISDKVIPTTVIGDTHIMGWADLFPHLNRSVASNKRRKVITLDKSEWHVLQHDTNFEGIDYAKGSMFKFWETEDFGYVSFHPSTKTPEGNRPGKLTHKY